MQPFVRVLLGQQHYIGSQCLQRARCVSLLARLLHDEGVCNRAEVTIRCCCGAETMLLKQCPRHLPNEARALQVANHTRTLSDDAPTELFHDPTNASQETTQPKGDRREGRGGREGTSTLSRTPRWRRWTLSCTISTANPATREEVCASAPVRPPWDSIQCTMECHSAIQSTKIVRVSLTVYTYL